MDELLKKVAELISNSKKILLVIHQDPDGDTIASSLALFSALKQKQIAAHVVGKDPVPAVFKFLPGIENIGQNFPSDNFDAIVVLDCGDLKRTGFSEQLGDYAKSKGKLINIDHHRKSDLHKIANLNIFDQSAAATSEIIYELIMLLGARITPAMATCLLCGLYTDTGGFRHSNTKPKILELASLLMERGANLSQITKNLDNYKHLSALKLWGLALSRINTNKKLGLVSSVITLDDLSKANASQHDLAGLVNLINSTAGAKAAVLFSQVDENTLKVSLRTERNDIDLSRLAEFFGGGGHKKAAGFSLPARIVATKSGWKVELE